jgi:hypothetical protein
MLQTDHEDALSELFPNPEVNTIISFSCGGIYANACIP